MTAPDMPPITIGADPELFVRRKSDGVIVSAHDLIPGTKTEPHSVPRGAIQVDGVAAEFNVNPSEDCFQFTANIEGVQKALRGYLGTGYELVTEPVAFFDEKYFETLPKATRELGCNPDFNAWTGEVNDPPISPILDGKIMRSAAGHVHIGWTKDQKVTDKLHFMDCCQVARQMDYFVGIWTLLWDPDNRRRKMYGKAGAFRPKTYGGEYRTPSNMWLKTVELQQWTHSSTQQAMYCLFNGKYLPDKFGDAARRIIDDNILDWPENPEFKGIIPATGLCRPLVPANSSVKASKNTAFSSYWNAPSALPWVSHG